MTNRALETIHFQPFRKRRVERPSTLRRVTSNGGALPLHRTDRQLGLMDAVAAGFADVRQRGKVRHRLSDMLRQRVYGIALGHEDLNGRTELRHDVAMQTVVERDGELAGAPTPCHPESLADRNSAWHVHKALFAISDEVHAKPPEEVVLGFDVTNGPGHGDQVGRAFHPLMAPCFEPGICQLDRAAQSRH